MGEFAQYGDAFATRNHERQPSMPSSNLNAILRALPSVEEVLNAPEIKRLERNLPARCSPTPCATSSTPHVRPSSSRAASNRCPPIFPRAPRRAMALLSPSLKRVVNASGVIVHTNLGRSVMAQSAVDAVVDVARGYSTLEYSVEGMCRGSRHDHCEQLICTLTGAEAAIAVNNNAAAVMMVLFRVRVGSRGRRSRAASWWRSVDRSASPTSWSFSHATMREVGTTSTRRTCSTLERAITDDTAMLLKVHTSNYRLVGFTESVNARAAPHRRRRARGSPGARGADAPDLLVYEDLRVRCWSWTT